MNRGNDNGSALLRNVTITYNFGTRNNAHGCHFDACSSASSLTGTVAVCQRCTVNPSDFFLHTRDFFVLTARTHRCDHKCNSVSHLRRVSRNRKFLRVLLSRAKGNLCLVSRPRSTLSARQRLALLRRVCQVTGSKSRFVVTARSPVLLNLPSTRVLSFSRGNIRPYSCRSASDCRVAEIFVGRHRSLLQRLLKGRA